MKSRAVSIETGFELGHSRRQGVEVVVEYRIESAWIGL